MWTETLSPCRREPHNEIKTRSPDEMTQSWNDRYQVYCIVCSKRIHPFPNYCNIRTSKSIFHTYHRVMWRSHSIYYEVRDLGLTLRVQTKIWIYNVSLTHMFLCFTNAMWDILLRDRFKLLVSFSQIRNLFTFEKYSQIKALCGNI